MHMNNHSISNPNIDLPIFESSCPIGVKIVIEKLKQAGFKAYLVGGCVRDLLLKRIPHDFDVTTNATPNQVLDLFAHAIPTGIAHGTITVIEQGEQIEVTTFRSEGQYQDHRHPDFVQFVNDVKEDLARRDFTINAMAWDAQEGLIDPFKGQHDLQEGIVRAVRDPFERMSEDALRMFRAFRFAGRYQFEIEAKTKQAIDTLYPLAQNVAVERIVPEVEEILANSPQILDQMTLLLQPWIPQLDVCLHTQQNSIYHYTDVLHHTLDALSALQNKEPVCLWALLLHDLGKPKVKQTYNGKDHFKKHERESVKIAQEVTQKLKLPKKMSNEIFKLIALHDTFLKPTPQSFYWLHVDKDLNAEETKHLFAIQYGDIMAHSQHDRLKALESYARYDQSRQGILPMRTKDLLVNGNDLKKEFGLQGKDIGIILEQLLYEVVMQDRNMNRQEQLALVQVMLQGRKNQ